MNCELKKAVTIGTFDGVHRGHQMVLEMLKAEASKRGLQPISMTFDRHPLQLICPERAPGNLLSTARKAELIRNEGVNPIILTFNEQLRSMSAYEWLDRIHRKYNVRMLIIGYDNTFGCDGIHLSLSDIKTMGEAIGIETLEAPEVPGISSSRIRKAIKAGDITAASEMLGHLPETEGSVISGFHVGTDIGFPTANLQKDSNLIIPGGGVYAAKAFVEGNPCYHPAMVNIGTRPTFEGTSSQSDHTTIEAHIIDYKEDLYGKKLRLEFIDRLRDEKKFKSVEALRQQLTLDKKAVLDLCLA